MTPTWKCPDCGGRLPALEYAFLDKSDHRYRHRQCAERNARLAAGVMGADLDAGNPKDAAHIAYRERLTVECDARGLDVATVY